MKMLIVEDQSGPLEALEHAVKKVLPRYYPEMSYDVARCYEDAQIMLQDEYEIVLLDHRLPNENLGNMEKTDFRAFCDHLDGIGYRLIRYIKAINPNTIVVGTSSMSTQELHAENKPDYVMSKMWGEAEKDLDNILAQNRK